MSVAEKLENIVKPIKPVCGQAYLFLDLTITENPIAAIRELESSGYLINLHLQEYPQGIHSIAVLRDELNVSEGRYSELVSERVNLAQRFGQDAVSLRRGIKAEPSKIHPLQVSVHDWIGQAVWADTQGYLCPELETPEPGQTVIYVDYEKTDDELIQSEIELAIDAMGYPAGSRWIGRNSLDVDNVVSYVGTFPREDVPQHLERLQKILPAMVLICVNGSK